MAIAADIILAAGQPFPRPANADAFEGDAPLREALRRCSPSTYEAVRRFRATRDTDHLPAILSGILERFAAPGLRPLLGAPCDDLRLSEDLGIDSLTMMETVSLAEEVFQVPIDNEALGQLRTVGDVRRFLAARLGSPPPPEPA